MPSEETVLTPTTYRVLDFVADAYDPLLTLLALIAPPFAKPRKAPDLLRFYAAAAFGIGFVYLVMAADNSFGLWRSFGLDYSTHSAFAAALVVSLAIHFRKWLLPLAGSLALYLALIVLMGYHGILDVLSAALVVSVATLLVHLAFRASALSR